MEDPKILGAFRRKALVSTLVSIVLLSSVFFFFICGVSGIFKSSSFSYDERSSKSRSLLGLNPRFHYVPSISETEQDDVFISVKTSHQFHETRIPVILRTWFQLARRQTWFFTDKEDPELDAKTNGHLRVTQCSSTHSRQALCCKMAAEFDAFLESGKRWFCHFDDDNYVNALALVRKLKEYDHREDWYLGKPSIPEPLEILDRDNNNRKLSFWFATGGAGFCLSRSLAVKMLPIAGGGKFESVGDKIRLPDDVTMGYIVEHVLKTPLTVIKEFHSHLEPQRFISTDGDQISFGYSKYGEEMNVVDIDNKFNDAEDPTRFKSLHCTLFPNFSWCPKP